MSRTDKTKPVKFQMAEGTDWSHIRFNGHGINKAACRFFWSKARAQEKRALKVGREPAPVRTRSSVKWDLS